MRGIAALLCLLLPVTAAAGVCRFPVPKFKIHAETGTGISQADFNAVLDEINQKYQPIFQSKGKQFRFNRLWSDGTVNSDAQWQGNLCLVDAYGGLARYPTMTKEAYRQVELHEIGHCLGGPPTFSSDPAMSVEGQADYYSAGLGSHIMNVDPTAASMTLAQTLAQLAGDQMPSRPGPVLMPVQVLFEDHPAAQCRLDTYDDAHVGRERPNCWYPNGSQTGGNPPPTPAPAPPPAPIPQPVPQPIPKPPPCQCSCCVKA